MMTKPSTDEFYVGYLDRAPHGLARFVKSVTLWAVVGLTAVFTLLAATQDEQPSGVFEFGVQREFEGVLYLEPVPYLRITPPGGEGSRAPATQLLLVGLGKHAIPQSYRRHDGRKVAFRGSLIYRENLAMIEMNDPDSFRELGEPAPGERRTRSGPIAAVELSGELVDTKCWLGVMRPATGKVHRGCAVRCLAGGVPPGLLVRDRGGDATVFLLVGEDGSSLELDPQLAARTIEVQGMLEFADGLAVVRVARLGLL